MKFNKQLKTGIILTALLFSTGLILTAQNDQSASQIFREMVTSLYQVRSMSADYLIITTESNGQERRSSATMKTKGVKLLLEFNLPADLKGTRLLRLDSNRYYVYLPAFGKVRRIASHISNQGFMGMTASITDLTIFAHFEEEYEVVKLISEDATMHELELQSKPGSTSVYKKIKIIINKNKHLPRSLELFDESGTKIKIMSYDTYSCDGNACIARNWVIKDLINNAETIMTRMSWKVNLEISDDVFSKDHLDK